MLAEIRIENFRCIERADLEFDPVGTGIVGRNASGKTSLLEAIYFLGFGRSFRTSQRERLLRSGAEHFRVVAGLDAARGALVAGVEHSSRGTNWRLAGEAISSTLGIAEVLPIQVIDPGIHRLVEEGSVRRRRLMDWGVFHVKHDFLHSWRRYQRALKQRNASLRARSGGDVSRAWEREMIAGGESVDFARGSYVQLLSPHFERLAHELLGARVTMEYRRGWPKDLTLEAALDQARVRDERTNTSSVGPHRGDIRFAVEGEVARDRISRGQQKMLAAAFILAQTAFRSASSAPTCLLLDDPAAELDVDNLGKLLRVIDGIPTQLIVTALDEAGLRGMKIQRRFHVEQGCFTAML